MYNSTSNKKESHATNYTNYHELIGAKELVTISEIRGDGFNPALIPGNFYTHLPAFDLISIHTSHYAVKVFFHHFYKREFIV